MSTGVESKLDGITGILTGMTGTLGTHTVLLERIWAAASEEPPKSQLPAALKAIEESLARHARALDRIEAVLLELPAALAAALRP